MDSGLVIQIVTIIILLMLSAFFSSAETALVTVNRIKMRTLADEGNVRAKRVLAITDHSSKMLSAILIGNNIVNLSASAFYSTCHPHFWKCCCRNINWNFNCFDSDFR